MRTVIDAVIPFELIGVEPNPNPTKSIEQVTEEDARGLFHLLITSVNARTYDELGRLMQKWEEYWEDEDITTFKSTEDFLRWVYSRDSSQANVDKV